MKAIEIRNKYLDFFKRHGHAVIPSAPLIPENDPSVLFTTAGMQPLVPYLLGEKHPEGTRLTDFQKCLRNMLCRRRRLPKRRSYSFLLEKSRNSRR